MGVITFNRMVRGGRKVGELSDMRVYVHEKGDRRSYVALRISPKVMRLLRWKTGDQVTASYDTSSKQWTLRRVTDNSGNSLSSQGHKTGSGTVRFVTPASQFKSIGFDGGSGGYECALLRDDPDVAVFERV